MIDIMDEKGFMRTIREALGLAGFRVWHDTVAYRSDAGFPDLVCVAERDHGEISAGTVLVAELKVGKSGLTERQRSWLRTWALSPTTLVYVWWPSDWPQVERIVRGERVPNSVLP